MSKPASSAQQFVDESTMLRLNHIPAIARMCHRLGLIDPDLYGRFVCQAYYGKKSPLSL